jgi:hypothetical protein
MKRNAFVTRSKGAKLSLFLLSSAPGAPGDNGEWAPGAPVEKRLRKSRRGEKGVQWGRFRGEKGNTG